MLLYTSLFFYNIYEIYEVTVYLHSQQSFYNYYIGKLCLHIQMCIKNYVMNLLHYYQHYISQCVRF